MLGDTLNECFEGLPECFDEPLKGHSKAEDFRALKRELGDFVSTRRMYIVDASVGKGRWAEVVWGTVFDELVTTTAQRGYYVSYLFSHDGNAVYLGLNQGTTEAHELFKRKYLEVLESQVTYQRILRSVTKRRSCVEVSTLPLPQTTLQIPRLFTAAGSRTN